MVYVYTMPSIPTLSDAQDRLLHMIAVKNIGEAHTVDPRTWTALEKKGMIRRSFIQKGFARYNIPRLTPKGRNYITAREREMSEGSEESQGD
jgi:DNA-binding MarR family transcriptional regulator